MEGESSLLGKIFSLVKNHKFIAFLVLAAVLGGGYYWYYKKANASNTATTYKTEVVKKGDLSVAVTGSGQVESVTQVDLKPVAAGDSIEVTSVYVKNDQTVKKDQLIALLDAQDALKSVRNAELSLESAKVKYASIKRQYDRDEVSKYDKETQRLAVEQAQNSLNDARDNLKDYYIRAPFDGIVTNLSVESGDSISRTDILASVITKDAHASVSLNEVDAVSVKEGDMAKLTFEALSDVSITGKVTKIDTIGTVSQGVVSYEAEISFDSQNKMLKPGMSVSAEIAVEAKNNIMIVPSGAVKTQDGTSYVLVLNNSSGKKQNSSNDQGSSGLVNVPTPERKKVEVGITNNVYTEIISGISVGDNVVTETVTGSATSSGSTSSGSSGLHIPGLGGGGGPKN